MVGKSYGKSGLILEAAGDITVDRNGLWTASCRFRFPANTWKIVPAPGTAHPLAWFITAERSRIMFTPGLWTAVVEYAGAEQEESIEPQYELSPGVGSEPIETHPDFVSKLAGKPSAPKNGAVFVDPKTGDVTTSDELGKYQFDRFAEFLDGGLANDFAGVKNYLVANNTVWTKSWTVKAQPASRTKALKIVSEPDGPAPSYGGKYDWLEHPVAYTKRGSAYSCVQRWILSGPKGWNDDIY